MKTLKKSLCLVLALVFVLSLCTVGAGAFSDDADIKYDDAVGIMTDLKILEGPEGVDGPFNPKDSVTRAQAAKMVAYMALGKDRADSLPKLGGQFPDVNDGDWYGGFVTYCVKQGIINGKTDAEGNLYFDPDAPVTGAELGKMILCALGYGKAEEYVGHDWKWNSIMDAHMLGVYDGSDADANLPATREECALYVFNTLNNIKLVSHKDGEYTEGTETFGQKSWKLENKTGVVLSMKATGNTAGTSIAMDKDSKDTYADGTAYTFNTDELEGIDEALIGHKVRILFKGEIDKIEKVYAVTDISTKVAKNADATAYSVPAGKTAYKIANYTCTPDSTTELKDATNNKAKKALIVCGNDIISFEGGNTYEIAKVTNVATNGKITIQNNTSYTTAKEANDTWIVDGTFALNDFVKVETIGTKVKVSTTEKVENVLINSKTTAPKYNGVYTVSDNASDITPAVSASALAVGTTYNLYMIDNEVFAAELAGNGPAPEYDIVYVVMGYTAHFDATTDEYGIETPAFDLYKIQFVDADGVIHYAECDAASVSKTGGLFKATYALGKYTLTAIDPAEPTDPKTAEFSGSKVFVNAEKIPGYSWFMDANTNVIILGKANPAGEAKASNLTATVSQPGKLNGDYSAVKVYLSLEPISAGSSTCTVKTVWITGAAEAEGPAVVAGSYMYVKSVAASGQTLLNGQKNPATSAPYDTYSVYIDGEKADVILTAAPSTTGFFTYTNNGDGTYTVATEPLAITGYKEFAVGGASTVTLYNGILSDPDSTSGLDGMNISALPVVDTRSTATIKSVADLAALKSTDAAVTITFVVAGTPAGPVGVIYVK